MAQAGPRARKTVLTPTKAASGLISAGPPSRTVRNKRLLFEPPGACDLFQRPELRLAAREGGAGNK